ncbi:DUF3093 domain-containing protein [Mycobacterium sp. 1274756.6]|uniref:DUF3093 domain-containing protein n=1 Tax=Mycobacterium sp. 1274756.6 TaxID=1834076 RepID=UPI000801AC82|nr:DUF3093 domain-containing protein [Mycobacterium sp. 1274756.6]OBJ71372.1 hypothetical protein A5643_07935 [Mycobacterium sp. 1274756.6]
MSGTRVAAPNVRYAERLWVPWWWWPLGFAVAAIFGYEVTLSLRDLPEWVPYVVLSAVSVGTLLWLGRVELRVVDSDGEVELWVADAHLPVTVIDRAAVIPRSAKSAALGRQLDPAAFVVHRAWIGTMLLVVLDDPEDPTPYWLVSCRNPDRLLAALQS